MDSISGRGHRSQGGTGAVIGRRRCAAQLLTRNQVRFAGATAAVPMLAQPTGIQREAFDLIGVPIPLTLK